MKGEEKKRYLFDLYTGEEPIDNNMNFVEEKLFANLLQQHVFRTQTIQQYIKTWSENDIYHTTAH